MVLKGREPIGLQHNVSVSCSMCIVEGKGVERLTSCLVFLQST